MLIGLRMSGSEATSCASKPGGRRKVFFSSSGASGSVPAMLGFWADPGTANRATISTLIQTIEERIESLKEVDNLAHPPLPGVGEGAGG